MIKFSNNKHIKVDVAYTGDGIEKCLIPHDREYDFDKRQKLAAYLPVYKMAIDSVVDPIFSKDPIRESTSELFNSFLENVDREGTNMDDYMKDILTSYKVHGNGFIIMDNFTEFPESLNDQLANRALPWVRFKDMTQLHQYETDDFNNILTIEFYNGLDEDDNQQVIGYTAETIYEYIIGDEDSLVTSDNPMGFVPVIKLDKKIKTHPASIDAADIGIMIYNSLSEQRDNERSLAFAMLQVPTNDDPDEIEVGNKNIITVSPDSTASAQYISPDTGILTTMRESAEKYLEFFNDIADKFGATVVKQSTPSGESLKMQFIGTSHVLKSNANYSEIIELKIADMFAKFINASFDYTVSYNKSYIDATKDINDDLELIKKAQELGITIDKESIDALTLRLNNSLLNY